MAHYGVNTENLCNGRNYGWKNDGNNGVKKSDEDKRLGQ